MVLLPNFATDHNHKLLSCRIPSSMTLYVATCLYRFQWCVRQGDWQTQCMTCSSQSSLST
jgi:hypothetical protein